MKCIIIKFLHQDKDSLYDNQYELYANKVSAKDGIKAVSFVFGLGDKEI